MKRRAFYQSLLVAGIPAILPNWQGTNVIKPRRLTANSRIGLISPGSPVPEKKIKQAIGTVKEIGLTPVLGQHAHKSLGYLAGTDAERASDLHHMFEREDIDAIWCLRGGYGCTRLLPLLDYTLIRRNPKLLIGYSDITALHLALLKKCGLVSFHGPVATSAPTDYTISALEKLLFNDDGLITSSTSFNEQKARTNTAFKSSTIHPGKAQGSLVGGNLSLLAALAGTPWSPNYRDKLVFIEDIGEKPYRIDRMLVQLFQATDLKEASGFILGVFNDCEPDPEENSLTLAETLENHFKQMNVPVCYGFSIGHIDDQCTIPQGIQADFDADALSIKLMEAPLS